MKSSRRAFLGTAGLIAAAAPWIRAQSPPLRAVVIGHTGRGDYGHGLEGIFGNRPDVELVAVADPAPAGRARVATAIGAPRNYADYREMLERERPQLASIAMRHADQHREIGMACLAAGAHCYFEKPFAPTPVEADELLDAARRKGLKIAVAHTMRMMPQVVRLRRAIEEGDLGDLAELRAFGKQDARAGGEDMMVLGTHLFDLLRMFAGDPRSVGGRVTSQGRAIRPEDRRLVKDNVGWVAGDNVFADFAFDRSVTATFTSEGRLRETTGHWGIEFHGSKGVARINCDIAPNVFLRSDARWTSGGRTDAWRPLDAALSGPAPEHNLGPVGDWLDAIARNREPECSGRNGAWAVEMAMGVYAAALSGRRIPFPLAQRMHPLESPA